MDIKIGEGVTESIGSDSYGYYITYVNNKNTVIGLCRTDYTFDAQHPWSDGKAVTEPYDWYKHKTQFYIKKYGKHWYRCSIKDDKIIRLHGENAKMKISFGCCINYRDPSF